MESYASVSSDDLTIMVMDDRDEADTAEDWREVASSDFDLADTVTQDTSPALSATVALPRQMIAVAGDGIFVRWYGWFLLLIVGSTGVCFRSGQGV
mmetsp:Transcript_26757/g.58555  ORF Transcript_26757/g.58555 Transcript_26757/m.58555 type:complete len:96 (+) Transcript_26757:757-1044(+)